MRIKILEQQIIQAVRLEDVVKRYAELFRGSNSGKTLRCNCLFHRDDGKSFKVKVTEQTYECGICKEAGNVVDLVQSLVGCNETEALYVLSDWYDIPIQRPGNLAAQKNRRREKCSKDVSLLCSIHENREFNMLFESLDFWKGDNALFAAGHKYLELGLSPSVLPDKYERLAGLMLFPVRDGEGVLQGFLKYMAEEKDQGCICYPPNLADNSLLGLYQAIKAIEKLGFVYLVWNCKDLLAMHVAGFTNQVRATKTAARLSFASAVTYRLSLSKKDLSALYRRMGAAKFEYYIRQSTRLVFLNALRDKWVGEQQALAKQSNAAKSKEEKAELRSNQIVIRNKLDKLSGILNENWGHLSWFFDKFVVH